MSNKCIVRAEKRGQDIILVTDTGWEYVFNFVNFTITSKRGQLKKTPLIGFISAGNLSNGERLLLRLCSERDFLTLNENSPFMQVYHRIETFLSALDICPTNIYQLPEENPKGYIKWLRENHLTATVDSLRNFKRAEAMKTLPEHIQQKLREIKNLNVLCETITDSLYTCEKITFIHSTIKNTFKNFEDISDLESQLENLCRDYERYSDSVDSNRSVAYNLELIQVVRNKRLYPFIETNQERFKTLEEIEHDNWEIIVPTTVEQLVEEGKQQNNCVGRLYPSHVNNGDVLVYFIRKKDSPDKSWHTCSAYIRPNSPLIRTYSDQVLIANNHNGEAEVVDWVKNVVDEKIKEITSNLR